MLLNHSVFYSNSRQAISSAGCTGCRKCFSSEISAVTIFRAVASNACRLSIERKLKLCQQYNHLTRLLFLFNNGTRSSKIPGSGFKEYLIRWWLPDKPGAILECEKYRKTLDAEFW